MDLFYQHYKDCESLYYEKLNNEFFIRFEHIDEILKDASDERFISEMEPWIDKLKYYGKAGTFALTLLQKRCKNEEISNSELNSLNGMIQYLKENKYRITAEIMNDFLSWVYQILQNK